MVFEGYIKRKLASLIRPWLVSQPIWEVHLQLGFFRTLFIIRNLRLDFNHGGGTTLTLDELVLEFSPWSAPAFSLHLHAINLTLSLQKAAAATSKRMDDSLDDYLQHTNRTTLALLDPQGSMLHQNIERMMMAVYLKTGLKDSITNLVLAHGCLHFHDARVRVEYPVSDDKFSWLCYSRTLSMESSPKQIRCLFGGFLALLFLPIRETSFILQASELELGTEDKHDSHIVSCVSPRVAIRIQDLHLVNLVLSVPEMNFSFSSSQLQMVLAFTNLFSTECKYIRSGRLLWKIARLKIHNVLLPPRYVLYKVVLAAVFWLRLVKEYQALLALLGYPGHGLKMLSGTKFLKAAEQHWQQISQKLETELPVEAIASARRVAHHGATQRAPFGKSYGVSNLSSDRCSFWKILLPLLIIWRAILYTFEKFKTFVFPHLTPCKVDQLKMKFIVVHPRCCLHLGIRKVSASLSLDDDCQISRKSTSRERTSKDDLISFFLKSKEFLFTYEEGICEQYTSFSIGFVKLSTSPFFRGSKNDTRLRNNHNLEESSKERQAGSKAIVWGEPSPIDRHSVEDTGYGAIPELKELSGEMELAWNRMRSRFKGSKSHYDGNPWAICGIRTSLVCQGFKSHEPGFLKCSFMVGKLNVALDYSSVASIVTLMEWVQCALYQCNSPLQSSRKFQDIHHSNSQEKNRSGTLKSTIEGLKMKIFKLVPENHVELKAVVTGPRVRLSIIKEGSSSNSLEHNALNVPDEVNFIVDVHNTEFSVRPTAMPCNEPGEHQSPSDDFESKIFKLQENMVNGFHESGNVEYVSRGQISHFYNLRLGGLPAYLENLAENGQMQILLLKPVTVKFPLTRDYLYSFGRSIVASSLSLHCVMSGATGLFYMDELFVISQVVESLFAAASEPGSSYSAFKASQHHQVVLEQQILQTVFVNEETLTRSNEGAISTLESDFFSIRTCIVLVPFDIVFHNSRNVTDIRFFPLLSDSYNIQMPDFTEPSYGIWLSAQRSSIDIFVGEAKVEVVANAGGFCAVLLKHKTGNADKSGIKNVILPSVDCLYEASLSGGSFVLSLDFLNDSKSLYEAHRETTNGHSISLLSCCPKISNSLLPNGNILEDGFKTDISDVAPYQWLLLNIAAGVVFMGPLSVKNDVLGVNVIENLQLSFSVRGEFQSILLEIQGGLIVIDMLVLVRFARCFTSYLDFVKTVLYMEHSHKKRQKSQVMAEHSVNDSLGTEHSEEPAQRNTSPVYAVRRELLEACSIDMSQFSLVLLSPDKTGVLREIIGRVTFVIKFWLEDRKQKFLFNLSLLEILSQNLYEGIRERKNQPPHFSFVVSSHGTVLFHHEKSPETTLCSEKLSVLPKDASCSNASKPPVSMESASTVDSSSSVDQTSRNCILERLTSSVSAEKLFLVLEDDQHCATEGWVGIASVSGLHLTISLSEIKMLMSAVESLSEVSGKGAANSVVEKTWSLADQKFDYDLETALPEGAIVTIQDVHQHVYITAESVENKFQVAGAVHYAAAGRQALFRVKWHKQKRWRLSTSCFSLVSLYAKTAFGDPLCLNYSASSFVDISSSNDSACALWKIASHEPEVFEDNSDLRPLSYPSRNTFYLVNKKNDCAVAFVHGAFEFVKKPGNPFKFKIFPGLLVTRDMLTSESHLLSANDPVPLEAENISDPVQIVPCVTLTVDKVSLTVVHELSEASDKLSLLQGSIDNIELTIQVLPLKIRVITTFKTMLYYFDPHKYIWRELVQPIESCVYWRSTNLATEENFSDGMQSRLHVRVQEFDLSLTELLLDILLFIIGKLDLAGPFCVESSAILASCCKVENQLNLELLCHCDNLQATRVGRNSSAFFFLRNLVDQPLEASCVTVCLEIPGMSSTSPIIVPLGKTQVFAWRTRIKSDTRTHPGPFIVFDISKNVEEGLALTVSPLLRIHNQTGFSVELRIQRADSPEIESASVLLKEGDTVDDCVAAFDAINLVGGPKKALRSLGNFVFSFRPDTKGETNIFCNNSSVDWSDNLEGGKAVRLSGVIDKFSYQFRKALSADSMKCSFSTAGCSVISGNAHMAKMHFLVQSITRDVAIMPPNDQRRSKISPYSLQEQKEILLLPTVRVSNLLESDIVVLLSETEISSSNGLPNINQAAIPFGLTVDLYAHPAVIFISITLPMFGSSCKPVNCGQCLKKLNKKKDGIQFLDIDLEFDQGHYFACLRLVRSEKGMLEAVVFTQYTLRNDTEYPLFCSTPNLKPLTRDQAERYSATTSPHLGSCLPPKSIRSSELSMTLFGEESSESTLDLDALTGRSEMSFTTLQRSGLSQSVKLGISLGPLMYKIDVPARLVSLVPRYVVSNESEGPTFVRQCFIEDDFRETLSINSKQKKALSLRVGSHHKRDITVLDKLLRKHKVLDDDFSVYVQFRPNENLLGWSGPVCVASLGRFFLKFKRSVDSYAHQSAQVTRVNDMSWEFAAVHVVEEASTVVLNYYRPPDIALPYRIENHLSDASITYYQKDTFEPETLASNSSVYYVWDDLTRPRRLVVKINGVEMLREISLDKLRPWKPFFRIRQQRELTSKLPSNSRISVHRGTNVILTNGIDVEDLGYEVGADGPTRVLRICHSPGSRIGDRNFRSSKMIQLRVSYFAIRLLEPFKRDLADDAESNGLSTYTPIIVGRLETISLDSIILDERKYNQFRIQSINVDEKWAGAPFAAMLRKHFTSGHDAHDSMLIVVFVIYPTCSSVQEVKYSSIILQPVDINIDEETLMKIVPFWRTSLSTNTQSQQYYFDHFEVHPIKIIGSFLPEDSYSSYSSGQETLRSLLHSVIKIPTIKKLAVELNGVLVTHALVTTRELLFRFGRHYSWYAMRAIYIAKGSQLLPPAFASVFDDLASSSLDVYFDPSSSLFNVRGLTLGTFKLISKCIENKGMSGSKRYFGDLSKTLRNAGSSILFAAVTEVTDSVLKGAESSGLNGMVTGFHHGILKLAMEPSVLGTAFLEGGPDRKIKLDRSPGVDELYIEGYLQAMLDTIYKQEYLRVRVIDDQVILKNLPPNSSLIDEIMDRVKDFLVSKGLLKGYYSTTSRPLRRLRGENEWRIGPTILTLCEHLVVSFAIRILKNQTNKAMGKVKVMEEGGVNSEEKRPTSQVGEAKRKGIWRWGIGKFVVSAALAYVDGRLCRCIPNPVARRIVSGFLLTFLDQDDTK